MTFRQSSGCVGAGQAVEVEPLQLCRQDGREAVRAERQSNRAAADVSERITHGMAQAPRSAPAESLGQSENVQAPARKRSAHREFRSLPCLVTGSDVMAVEPGTPK